MSLLKEAETKEEIRAELIGQYQMLMERLEQACEKERITEYTKQTIRFMSGKVTDAVAKNYEAVRKGVKEVVGGQILEYEAKTILRKGRKEGQLEVKKSMALKLAGKGAEVSAIADFVEESEETVTKWLREAQG